MLGARTVVRVESLLKPPLLFGRSPVRNRDAQSVVDTYARALAVGATGIEATARVTNDGVVVLTDTESVRVGLRRRAIADVQQSSLPAGIPSLNQLYERFGTSFDLALEVADSDDAAAVIRTARGSGDDQILRRLWLVSSDWERLAEWRERWAGVRLVNRVSLTHLRRGPERRAAQLAAAHIDAVQLAPAEWTGGLTTLFHRFERNAFATGAPHERIMRDLVRMGIDGLTSDHVERMVGALRNPGG
jgi:glycerophosphoryl diester phosphodiesterase